MKTTSRNQEVFARKSGRRPATPRPQTIPAGSLRKRRQPNRKRATHSRYTWEEKRMCHDEKVCERERRRNTQQRKKRRLTREDDSTLSSSERLPEESSRTSCLEETPSRFPPTTSQCKRNKTETRGPTGGRKTWFLKGTRKQIQSGEPSVGGQHQLHAPSLLDPPCRIAAPGFAGGNVADHDRAGGDDGFVSDRHPLANNGICSDKNA